MAERERGTVLLLMPAAVIVLLVLGAITFDYAHVYLAKQELQTAAEAAAQDAVTFGVDQAAVRRGDGARLDPDLVQRAVETSLAVHDRDLVLEGPPVVTEVDDTHVRVALTARVSYVFVPVVPGVPGSTVVRAEALATALP